jgi:hypothetical protein
MYSWLQKKRKEVELELDSRRRFTASVEKNVTGSLA